MAASIVDIVGSLAGVLTTVAFVPQVVKTWRTRQTRDISLAMWAVFWIGVACWTIYGLMLEAWPMVVANLLTLVLAGVILVIKLRNLGSE